MKTEEARKLRDAAEYHLREMAQRTKQLADAGWQVNINDKSLQIKISRPMMETFDEPLRVFGTVEETDESL